MKTILGLDLGTNSIGWALIQQNLDDSLGKVLAAGTRILPMSQDIMGKFDSGQSISQTAERTGFRSIRRLRERQLLRRERLHRVLNILDFLPAHYSTQIDFEKRVGQFLPEAEPKLAFRKNGETNQPEFIFKESFCEMLNDFKANQPQLVESDKKVPYDWTIYYLRKKALTKKIGKEELAWLLLHFNQKRGYYQLRGENEENDNPNNSVTFHSLLVTDVTTDDYRESKSDVWYDVELENGWVYRRSSKNPLFDWKGKKKEFIVTTELNPDGSVKTGKDGKEKRSFRAVDSEKDWTAIKKSTEEKIERSNKTVGEYIYDSLLQNPKQKIKGKLVRVVERKYYKAELEKILRKQKGFHPVLNDLKLYKACIEELYENNEAHKTNLNTRDFTHLFLNDIIFYQRPLRSKKSLISNCKFESRSFSKEGVKEIQPLKCIAKSHPLFQEFRLWQFIQNLRIYQREKEIDGKLYTDVNVTDEFLPAEEDWAQLFEWLNEQKEIDQKDFLRHFKKKVDQYRWNYVEDKVYPCNETRHLIKSRLTKLENVPAGFLTNSIEENLWHILYSIEDKAEIVKALRSFATRNGLGEEFVEQFKKIPPFKKDYGSYSYKAIKKLLPLMRLGKLWNSEQIDLNTRERIDKILTGEFDEKIRNRVREKALHLNSASDFRGLPLWLVSYIVYDRHSEDGELLKWKTAIDIQTLPQHSLRNPIVEQVINETLQVVKAIWNQYGHGKENFFDEIHIELGREMKKPAVERKRMTDKINDNEATNLRIKALLTEMLNDAEVENVRPYSPMQQEILKIYEEGVLGSEEDIPDDILKISKQAQPTTSELTRYKLWLQQKYRSPYTGEIIPLNKLFTRAYDIEHIIPQSRYFDDSFSNKVICEVEVNKDKDNNTAYEYIKKNGGKKVELSYGKDVTVFKPEDYENFVKNHYSKSRLKMKKMLMEDIPEDFILRQLNDSRYISKVVKNLLSNIVREPEEQEAISKHVVPCSGSITSVLKQDWGLNDVWNEIITPRFERLNGLTSSGNYGEWQNKDGKRVFQIQMPLQLQKGFSKKRIDHRHHALDAIVIACASRSHINFLNNASALGKGITKEEKEKKRFDLKHKLCFKHRTDANGSYRWVFKKPWDSFTQESKEVLYNIIVSFKQNLRVVNKSSNYYQSWSTNGSGIKVKQKIRQSSGDSWAVRKPMHKDTVSGLVQLKFIKEVSLSSALENWQSLTDRDLRAEVKKLVQLGYDKKRLLKFFKDKNFLWNERNVSKVSIFYWDKEIVASRVKIDESFTTSKIKSITDSGIQKIMLNHLRKFDEDVNEKTVEHPELAFSTDGVEEMNQNMVELNNGKPHQAIYKVRTFEPKGNKFNVGVKGNKKTKYVEAAKGTNLFFAVYQSENGKRSYDTIPLNVVVERQKQGLSSVPETNGLSHQLLFSLSPNDIIYLPTDEERGNVANLRNTTFDISQLNRLYKIVSFTGNRLYAIPYYVAKAIVDKVEFTQLNKLEFSLDRIPIKDYCIKLDVDRLGNLRRIL